MIDNNTPFIRRGSLYPLPSVRSPNLWRGMTIGLLGGSFNPVHEGHILISSHALGRLPIDCLWWNFTPQNPFKKHISMPSVAERIDAARRHITDPRIVLSDLEEQLGIYRTADFCGALNYFFPKTRFIWIGGIDLAEDIHNWKNWQTALHSMPFVFIKRPPFKGSIRRIPAKLHRDFTSHYCLPRQAQNYKKSNIYWDYYGRGQDISSTQIRCHAARNNEK